MDIGRTPDRVVVVTGIGGMGIACARRLGPGHHLVVADYSAEALARVASTLRDEGHWVTEVATDVSDAEAVQHLAETAASLGPIATVVHTAGVSPVQSTPDRIIAVDVLGTALVLDAFLPHVGAGTAAVCIASMAGTMTSLPADVEHLLATTPTAELAGLGVLDPSTMDGNAAYGIAKRANQLRVCAMSIPWGERGARVNSVSPALVSTPMGRQELVGPSAEPIRQMILASPAKRLGTAEDVVNAVQFLVSSAANFVTGTDLLVDGGTISALTYGDPAAVQLPG